MSERGSVSVLTAAVLFLAASLCLASVDLLRATEARARAQAAADAAALAAARELAIPTGQDPSEAAREYAERNGATLRSCSCPIGATEAVVDVEVPLDLVFVGADRTVEARARAVVEGAGGAPGGTGPIWGGG